jgi:hypothetical protein
VDRDALVPLLAACRVPFAGLPRGLQEVREHLKRLRELNMTIWQMLSPGFREETLSACRRLRRHAARWRTAVMVPAMLALHLAGFVAGLLVSRFVLGWPASADWQWAFAVFWMPLAAVPGGILVEGALGRGRALRAERDFLFSFGIGCPLTEICPVPWYHRPGVQLPATVVAACVMGWLIVSVLPRAA